jgi:hypothetical protein
MTPIYASAILLRETVGEDEEHTKLVKPFSTIPNSFFTTFRCIMGDCSAVTGQPLPVLFADEYGWIFAISYIFLIVITSFGLFNVIIAIYVENIIVAARSKEAAVRQERYGDVERMNLLLAEVIHEFVTHFTIETWNKAERRTVNNADWLASLEITKEIFDEVMNKETIHRIFDDLDIPYEERLDLFEILDADSSGSLGLGEITSGLKKLRGPPRRSDVIANGLTTRAMQQKMHIDFKHMDEYIKNSSVQIECLRDDTEVYTNRITELIRTVRTDLKSMMEKLSHPGEQSFPKRMSTED